MTSSNPTSRRARRATTHLDATAVTSLSTREASMSSSTYTSKFALFLTFSLNHLLSQASRSRTRTATHICCLPANRYAPWTRASPGDLSNPQLGAAILCARGCTPCVLHAGASLPSRSRSSRSSSAARPTMALRRRRATTCAPSASNPRPSSLS